MIANVLITLFVTAFTTITAFGHALLIAAVWPDLSVGIGHCLRTASAHSTRRQLQTKTTRVIARNKERLLEP